MGITTHVLDTATGRPGEGIEVTLEWREAEIVWKQLGKQHTNPDGRIKDFQFDPEKFVPGIYRLTFQLEEYFKFDNRKSFYPHVTIVFKVENADEHYHVPLLLNNFGYSTYRGS